MAMVFNHNKRNIVAKPRDKRRGIIMSNSKAKPKPKVESYS